MGRGQRVSGAAIGIAWMAVVGACGESDPPAADAGVDAGRADAGADATSNDASADGAASECACNADVDGNGSVVFFSEDNRSVAMCRDQTLSTPCSACASGTCADADIDCNGRVDDCDSQRIACAELGTEGCCEVPCGACMVPTESACSGAGLEPPCCRAFTEEQCLNAAGTFVGDDAPCPS